ASMLALIGLHPSFLTFLSGAQAPFRTGIDLVSFTVTVTDHAGASVGDLRAEDFEVREDGKPQEVTYFSPGGAESEIPLHIGLLFDTSESMERDITFSRGAAIKFLGTFPKVADFTLVDFDSEVRAARFSQSEFPR